MRTSVIVVQHSSLVSPNVGVV